MREFLGWIRFFGAGILCCAVLLGASLGWIAIPTTVQTDNTVSQKTTAPAESVAALQSDTVTQAPTETAATSSAAVATAAGAVAGSVSEQLISPYNQTAAADCLYVKNSTDLLPNWPALLQSALPYTIDKNQTAQVLIVHTHTTECYLTEYRDYYTDTDETRSQDESRNVVRLGNILADRLNQAGIVTVHDTTLHDYPSYNGSYDRSRQTILENLKKYPNIKIVIDLHRDAIAEEDGTKVKPTVEINGKKAAQIMLVMGSQSGGITTFPNYEENLKLACRLQQKVEQLYPALARPLLLMSRIYNENLTTGSLLLEIGTEVNTIDEAAYAAELTAEALVQTLEEIS